MKETAALNVDKGALALNKNDTDFEEYIIKLLSTRLAERIVTILEHEPEIVIRQSELRVEEYIPTNTAIYKRFVEWNRLVRCKDCKHYHFADNRAFGFPVKRCEWTGFEDVDDMDFCSRGERKDGDHHEG